MTEINKQRFIAELIKLLSFMHEEDRLAALEQYEEMFDECNDEQALIQLLMSPTRQAVLIARKYDTPARRSGGDAFLFLEPIYNQRETALERGILGAAEDVSPAAEVLENQVSLFDEEEAAAPLEPAEAPVEEEPKDTEYEIPAPVEAPAQEPSPEEAISEEAPVEEAAPEAPVLIRSEDEISAFIASFEREAAALNKSVSMPAEEAAQEDAQEPAREEPFFVFSEPKTPVHIEEQPQTEAPLQPAQTVRKTNPALLILFIVFAVPITAAAEGILLVPAALVLALTLVLAAAGVICFSAVFSGFAVLADILVVLGVATVILSLALFLLWFFIWFVIAVMIGLIRAVVSLGRKWCSKEVSAE